MSTQLDLIKEIFSSEINAVNEKLDLHAKIQSDLSIQILEQVKKTNGRVTELEKFKTEAEIVIATRVKPDDIKCIEKKIRTLEDLNIGNRGFVKIFGTIMTAVFAFSGFIWVAMQIYNFISK